MTELAAHIKSLILQHLPDATVQVDDPDGAHLSAIVISPSFKNLPKIQQHKRVYAALGNAFEDQLHALQLTTKAE